MITFTNLYQNMARFTVGHYTPDFILAAPHTYVELYEFIGAAHIHQHGVKLSQERFGKTGLCFDGAILLMDRGLPEGIVRFENGTKPDDPHLNGEWRV